MENPASGNACRVRIRHRYLRRERNGGFRQRLPVGLDTGVPDNVHISHYKKDDWEDWSTPFLFGILDDILFKEKMRLADMAALDGVINVIRLWRLGKSDKQILSTRTAVNKLLGILQHNVGGGGTSAGVMDIVWDDMIDLKVEYPPTDKILGPEKYASVNVDIVKGLGIPDALVGGSDLSTRNRETAFVQLKTLTERLEYIRHKCIQWLEGELQMVADAMGFKRLPIISFGRMSLRDEAAEKQLLIQLLDRGVISVESIHAAFGYDFMVELQNLRDEQKLRDDEPPVMERAGPYHRPNSVVDRQFEHQTRLQRARTDQGGGGDNPSGDQPGDEGDNGPGWQNGQSGRTTGGFRASEDRFQAGIGSRARLGADGRPQAGHRRPPQQVSGPSTCPTRSVYLPYSDRVPALLGPRTTRTPFTYHPYVVRVPPVRRSRTTRTWSAYLPYAAPSQVDLAVSPA